MNNSIKYRKYIKKLDTPPPSAVSRFSRGDQEAIDHWKEKAPLATRT